MIPRKYIDYYGDQTRWFIGTVVSLEDPEQLGRIRVRIYGIHSENKTDISDADLPWAQVVMPIGEGGTKGLGNNLGIQVDSLAFGIFLDGANSQLPLVVGSLPKFEENSPGGRSTNQLARGTKEYKVNGSVTAKTPDSVTGEDQLPDPYGAVYPDNKVTETKSGHVIEIDDSEGKERIHIYHKSGTFIEMHESGDVVTHHKNGFRTVTGNDKLHVTGDMNITVDQNLNITVKGNLTENVTGSVSETYGNGQTTSVTGDQKTTTTGKILLN